MYRLVIIDDEEKILDGMSGLFPWNEIGFDVAGTFTRAADALEFIRKEPVDVVLTDIEMPDMSGIELSRQLMEMGEIQTVLFSSYTNYEYFRAAIHHDVVDYLLKPVKFTQLLECFERVKGKLDHNYQKSQSLPKSYYEQIIDSVTEYLYENYRTATLEDAAVRVNLSSAYLSRVFKEKSGMNFSELLLKVRMEKACEMLEDIQYKNYDIAFYVGYDNPKNFSRAFKAYYHISPSEYRKNKMGRLDRE